MFSNEKIISLIDLTSLNDNDTHDVVRQLCQKAQTPNGHVAAVCVYPQFVATAKQTLPENSNIGLATVVNFPSGNEALTSVATQTQQAIADGAYEIDLVLPYQNLQAGKQQEVSDFVKNIADICHAHQAKLKVILETGALSAEQIHLAAKIAIEAGADFLKTSTGKIKIGATPEAAAILLEEIRKSNRAVGIKLSGGIRDVATAQAYLQQAAAVFGEDWLCPQNMRIGASALLDALLSPIKNIDYSDNY